MIVYRMENRDGDGPYHARGPMKTVILNAHNTGNGHPTPLADLDIGVAERLPNEHLRFAFFSVEGLKAWFAGFLSKLAAAGFAIRGYEVHRRYVWSGKSRKQLVFNRKKAKRVSL